MLAVGDHGAFKTKVFVFQRLHSLPLLTSRPPPIPSLPLQRRESLLKARDFGFGMY
jgi:hypothetical protein